MLFLGAGMGSDRRGHKFRELAKYFLYKEFPQYSKQELEPVVQRLTSVLLNVDDYARYDTTKPLIRLRRMGASSLTSIRVMMAVGLIAMGAYTGIVALILAGIFVLYVAIRGAYGSQEAESPDRIPSKNS
jgi:hypothetical protein